MKQDILVPNMKMELSFEKNVYENLCMTVIPMHPTYTGDIL